MRRFACRCGHAVYFENLRCLACRRSLAFDPATLDLVAEESPGAGLPFCANRDGPSRCNWLSAEGEAHCLSCRTSRVIPALDKPKNRERWLKLETAKRRLLYELLRLGLPVDPGRLGFVFKEDRRTNPDVRETHVATGHLDGTITINAAEADDVFRETQRVQFREPVRTVLGHFRHESGHYYFAELVDDDSIGEVRRLFGDERADYAAALAHYYRHGPPADWATRFVSGYASAHPAEDWAECWSHYLQIRAALEAAEEHRLRLPEPARGWHMRFTQLVLVLNELMRSLGQADAYPFVLTGPVIEKLECVHRLVEAQAER